MINIMIAFYCLITTASITAVVGGACTHRRGDIETSLPARYCFSFSSSNAPTQLPTDYHTGSAAMGAVGLGEDIAEIYVGIRMPLLLHRMSSYEAQHAQPNARQFLKNETKVAMLCRNNIVDKSILRVA